MTLVQIEAGDIKLEAELFDNETADAIEKALPLEGRARRWGEEIYFGIPVHLEASPDATAEVEVGHLGYWPAGRAFCVFFGPTPASQGTEPRAASPVNLFGRVRGDAKRLVQVDDDTVVQVRTLPAP